MPNIFHQSVEDILKAATPEQKIVWNDIFLRYGERPSVSQFFYKGLVTSAEFNTYVARRMYFALQLNLSGQNGVAQPGSITLFDETNTASVMIQGSSAYWDATAAGMRVLALSVQENNLVFSRLSNAGSSYIYINFIGYRIIY